jgi:hypothetical protein
VCEKTNFLMPGIRNAEGEDSNVRRPTSTVSNYA